MTRRRWLWVTGVASASLFAVLAGIDSKLVDEGGWGIVDFELAGSREDAQRMVSDWGADGHDAARLSLWLDYLYMVAYGAFGALAVAAVRDMSARRGWRRFERFAALAVPLPIAAALCDALENAGLLLALGGHGGDVAPAAGMAFALAKFAFMTIAFWLVAIAVVRWAWACHRVVTGMALGALALLAVAVLAVGVATQGDTERAAASARPDARDGRVLRLDGGDLHVEDRGRRGDAAIVLVHGFTGSTRWWSRIAPALARERRVVNVDLLGHGRSEKPRDGYGMDEQARLVLGALRELGVRRAVVVGHSLGGWVAVSMAEQDPRVVRGVAAIGTPADEPEGPGPVVDRLGFAPVVGPALWESVPESYVRDELASAFAEGTPVPGAFVDDTRALTWRAYAESARAGRDFREERAPYERMTASRVPLLAISGSEDERAEAETTEEWERVPGARVVTMRGVGHTPPWERPGATAAEVERFAGPLLR